MSDMRKIKPEIRRKAIGDMPQWASTVTGTESRLITSPEWIYRDTYQAALMQETRRDASGRPIIRFLIYVRKRTRRTNEKGELEWVALDDDEASEWLILDDGDAEDKCISTEERYKIAINYIRNVLMTGTIETWYETCANNPGCMEEADESFFDP